MKILAFAASNSRQSINRQLVIYASQILKEKHIPEAEIELIDLNDFEMPIYSADRQQENGIPKEAHRFLGKIKASDGLLISYAEHNGGYTAAFKNIFDWASRIEMKVFSGKPMVVTATSPGKGGASSVLDTAINSAHFYGADIVASLSVPMFSENFDSESGQLLNEELDAQLDKAMAKLADRLGR